MKQSLSICTQSLKEEKRAKDSNIDYFRRVKGPNIEKTIISEQRKISSFCKSFQFLFSDIAGNILKKRKYKGKHSFQDYLKHALPNSHVFFDYDQIEVEYLI